MHITTASRLGATHLAEATFLTGAPVLMRAAQRIEESLRFAFLRNAVVREGGGIITDSSDFCEILRMTVVTFLRNPQNDGGNLPSKSSE